MFVLVKLHRSIPSTPPPSLFFSLVKELYGVIFFVNVGGLFLVSKLHRVCYDGRCFIQKLSVDVFFAARVVWTHPSETTLYYRVPTEPVTTVAATPVPMILSIELTVVQSKMYEVVSDMMARKLHFREPLSHSARRRGGVPSLGGSRL